MTSTVRDTTPAVDAMSEDYPIITALLGGTTAMRKAAKTYLPQWPNESSDSYDNRRKTATLFPAFGRTCEVLTGKPFSKPVTFEDDVPPQIEEWCDNVD